MAKFRINLWVTETRLRQILVDASSKDEADMIAEKAISNTRENGGDESWDMEECYFDFDVYELPEEMGGKV